MQLRTKPVAIKSAGMAQNQPIPGGGLSAVKRLARAFCYSMDGIRSAFKGERAFREEFIMAVILIPGSLFMPVGWAFRALMIVSVLAVLGAELLNSAIEAAVDYISMDRHPLAKKAKDMGSAAVLMSLLACGTVWGVGIWICCN